MAVVENDRLICCSDVTSLFTKDFWKIRWTAECWGLIQIVVIVYVNVASGWRKRTLYRFSSKIALPSSKFVEKLLVDWLWKISKKKSVNFCQQHTLMITAFFRYFCLCFYRAFSLKSLYFCKIVEYFSPPKQNTPLYLLLPFFVKGESRYQSLCQTPNVIFWQLMEKMLTIVSRDASFGWAVPHLKCIFDSWRRKFVGELFAAGFWLTRLWRSFVSMWWYLRVCSECFVWGFLQSEFFMFVNVNAYVFVLFSAIFSCFSGIFSFFMFFQELFYVFQQLFFVFPELFSTLF